MTATRRVEFTYDAPDDETADWFADYLRRLVIPTVNEPVEFEDLARLETAGIGELAWSSERVRPFDPPWYGDGPSGMGAPEGWHVTWCPGCCYSVTYTEAELADSDDGSLRWFSVVNEAIRHDCPARVPT